jgi:hypothetical protein
MLLSCFSLTLPVLHTFKQYAMQSKAMQSIRRGRDDSPFFPFFPTRPMWSSDASTEPSAPLWRLCYNSKQIEFFMVIKEAVGIESIVITSHLPFAIDSRCSPLRT